MIEVGMIVETNQKAVGQLRYEAVLRSYTERIPKDEPGARFAAGLRGNVQRITVRDLGKPMLVEVTFTDGREDCLFVEWLDVVS